MTSVTTQDIELSRLVVNTENPRFEILANQREAIDRMLSDQGQKIVNLARDIVENGVNPSELTIVSPLASEKGMFNVVSVTEIVCLKDRFHEWGKFSLAPRIA